VGLLNRLWRRITERAFGLRVTVTGISMSPTFSEGDVAMVEPGRYRSAEPSRFDVVVVRAPGTNREDIKRIVGLPNELVEIRDGSLWIDGEVVAEPHIASPMPSNWLHAWGTRDNEYIVLGDNRGAPGIIDSRKYGPLERGALVGPIVRRLS
jgi:signal peptidase I